MPALHRPDPPERPDPVVLLIDAVIIRQSDLAQRLAQQWIHRHGLAAFARLGRDKLLPICGEDGLLWLQDQLGLSNPQPLQEPQQPEPVALGSLIRDAISEALQPLQRDRGRDPSTQTLPAATPADPWQLPSIPSFTSSAQSSQEAAPAPADLAGLRAWLHNDAA